MKILIIDDGDQKVSELLKILERLGINSEDVEVANNSNHAKSLLREKQFSVVVVDLCISVIAGGAINPRHGIDLLLWILNERSIRKKPWAIFGLTSLAEADPILLTAKRDHAHLPKIVNYININSLGPIVSSVETILELEHNGAVVTTSHKCDIAILCALDNPEYTALLEVFPASANINRLSGMSATASVNLVTDSGASSKVLLCAVGKMGSVASSFATSELIRKFNPKLIVLGGITGGIPGKSNIGDLICSEPITNFQGGKIKEGRFLPDVITEPTSAPLFEYLSNQISMNSITDSLHTALKGNAPEPLEPRFRLGHTGCSDLVVADEQYISSLKDQYRQMIGVEMEGFGSAFSVNHHNSGAKFLMIKCVCDLAGKDKDDRFQKYCALMSFKMIRELAIKGYIY